MSLRSTIAVAAALLGFSTAPLSALSLQDVILYVLETNPEITAAEANKQAIEFELDQARSFRAPRFELEAFAGYSINDGSTTPSLSASDDWIDGYEVSGRVTQLLYDGFQRRSEIERQAYRIDAAASRVLERSEVLSLEAIRLYSDMLRVRSLVTLAGQNREYHTVVRNRIQRAYDSGVVGIADLNQANERLLLAEDTVVAFELDLEDTKTLFLAIVGVEPTDIRAVPSIASAVPGDLDTALGVARSRNPTIKFAQADVGAAEALSRRVDGNSAPRLSLEGDVRYGEDVGGFTGEVADARVGLVMRYDFQGSSKRSARQEQVRRVSESRARLLSQTRRVEQEVRQSWATLESAKRRTRTLAAQADLALTLRQNYEEELEVGQRSLLDVLNTQSALFQAQANLINARALENYVNYRILAASGVLLATLGIEPPEDSKVYAVQEQGAPQVGSSNDKSRLDASEFRNWRNSLDQN